MTDTGFGQELIVTRDGDVNGPAAGKPEEKWVYYAAEGKLQLTKVLYGALRYSVADPKMISGVVSDGKVDRLQVGGGFWLTKNLLMKAEWVNQKYSGFAPGVVINNGIQAWKNPTFKGFVSEVSFAF